MRSERLRLGERALSRKRPRAASFRLHLPVRWRVGEWGRGRLEAGRRYAAAGRDDGRRDRRRRVEAESDLLEDTVAELFVAQGTDADTNVRDRAVGGDLVRTGFQAERDRIAGAGLALERAAFVVAVLARYRH